MPTSSDPNRYKIVCEVDLRRSEASITRPPLTLTFRDPTTVARSSVPARSATHTHPASVSTVTANPASVSNATVAEHSSTSSHIAIGWAAFDTAMRRIEETFSRAPFVSAESSGATNPHVFVFGQGNGASVAASHRSTASSNAPSSILAAAGLTGATTAQLISGGQGNGASVAESHRSTSSTNALSSALTAAGLTGATNPDIFVFGQGNGASGAASHRSTASSNAPSSVLTAAGLTGATNAQRISGGQGNGASVAVSHRSAASTNAPSSVLTAAELWGAIHPQPQPFVLDEAPGAGVPFPPIPPFPALPWYEIARPQLPTQNPTNHIASSTLQPLVLGEAPVAGVAAPLSIVTGGGLSGPEAVQNYLPSPGLGLSGNAARVNIAVPQVASRRVTRQSSSSATVPSSDSVAPRRSTRVKRRAPV